MSESADAVVAVQQAMAKLNTALENARALGINCTLVAEGDDKNRNVGRWSTNQFKHVTAQHFSQQRNF
jgi:hypothetical protein